jgi:SNF2 family DNA or RNA helicase
MVAIHAELTAGGEDNALLAAGPAEHVAMAAKQLQLLTPHFSKSDPPGALVVPASWPAVVQLAAAFGPSWCPGPALREWIASETARRTASLPTALPEWLQLPEWLTPRDYQVAGAWEIARTNRTLIFDEPRTGKTITTILGLSIAAGPDAVHGLPILVVCPASVVDPWVEAFSTWAPWWTTVAWRGSKRRGLAHTADVYVTSYDTARIDASEMSKDLVQLEAQSLVIDESHYIKNNQTHRSRAVRRLAKRVQAFVALSGTPITHHPADLWPTLACLAPEANPAKERWVNRYCQVIPGEYDDQIIGLLPATEPEFRLSILGQHRRVARADVMAQLPPKTYSVRTVDMPAKWRKVYDDLEEQMLAELPDGSELSVMDTLSVLTHLSTLACAAADVEITYGPDVDENTGEEKRHVHLDLKAPSWKVDALLEILAERPGEQVVAFAPSAQLVRLAGAAAANHGYRVGYVVGGQSAKERTAARHAFQDGELDLICATTSAGGEGITLSAAGTLVFLQRPWSLVKSLQAEDRAEGDMSATRGTEIVDVVTRNTIDTRVRSVLRERAGQLADLVQDKRIVAQLLGGASVTRLEAVS